MVALIVGATITVLTIIEPGLSPTLVITLLGFIATIVISLFGLLRTEQNQAERKDHIKSAIVELLSETGIDEIEAAEGNTDAKESILTLLRRLSDHAPRPRR